MFKSITDLPRSSAFFSFSFIISCVRASGATTGRGAKGGGFGRGVGKDALSLLKASKRSIDCLEIDRKPKELLVSPQKLDNYLDGLTHELEGKIQQLQSHMDLHVKERPLTCLSALLVLSSSTTSKARILRSDLPSRSANSI